MGTRRHGGQAARDGQQSLSSAREVRRTSLSFELETIEEKENSVQLAVARATHDCKVLLKIRPQITRHAEWQETASLLEEVIVAQGGEVKRGAAPHNLLVRQLEASKGQN